MNEQDIKTFSEIVKSLVVKNMSAGASFEKSKRMAFNRLEKECPQVLYAWLESV